MNICWFMRSNCSQLINLTKTKFRSSNFPKLWHYILQSFTESTASHKKRFAATKSILREITNTDMSTAHTSSIIQYLCADLHKFRTGDLVALCEFCVEFIQKGDCSKMRYIFALYEHRVCIIPENTLWLYIWKIDFNFP